LAEYRFHHRRNAVVDIYRHWNIGSISQASNENVAVSDVIMYNSPEICHHQQTGFGDLATSKESRIDSRDC
jgi:hypothetical protein